MSDRVSSGMSPKVPSTDAAVDFAPSRDSDLRPDGDCDLETLSCAKEDSGVDRGGLDVVRKLGLETLLCTSSWSGDLVFGRVMEASGEKEDRDGGGLTGPASSGDVMDLGGRLHVWVEKDEA